MARTTPAGCGPLADTTRTARDSTVSGNPPLTHRASHLDFPPLRGALSDVQLVDATPDHLSAIGACFGLLDSNRRPRGVQGTKLAKLLHRKRPALIPLYDEHIRSVYQDGAKAPVPKVRGRSWQDFMALLSAAIQSDLRRNPDVWSELARLTPAESEPITTVRALDIVAWGLGGR